MNAAAHSFTNSANELNTQDQYVPSWLDQLVEQTHLASTEQEKQRAFGLISQLAEQVLEGEVLISDNLTASIDYRIAQLDQLISDQVNEILHHAEFQQLEASWRGLSYLTSRAETGSMLKVRMMHATKQDLIRDFKTSADFDQSATFRQVYEEEYGTFGGSPFASLVVDFEFGRSAEDMYLLEQLSHVGAASHAPVIAAAAPSLFGLESFTDITRPRDLSKTFETVEYVKWRSFRESEDARYVGLVLPHVLGRLPYGPETQPVESFGFAENMASGQHTAYLWVNAAYAYAANLADAFSRHGWLAAIRGVEGGGLVSGLPVHTFQSDEGHLALKCPTEVALTDRLEKQLSDLGFIGLVHCKIQITQRSLVANQHRNRKPIQTMPPTQMLGCLRNYPMCMPYLELRITSKR
jgi:type VI secretion system protein ImpC